MGEIRFYYDDPIKAVLMYEKYGIRFEADVKVNDKSVDNVELKLYKDKATFVTGHGYPVSDRLEITFGVDYWFHHVPERLYLTQKSVDLISDIGSTEHNALHTLSLLPKVEIIEEESKESTK